MSEQISSGQFNDISKLNTRQRGQVAELAFMRKAATLGFAVSRPWQEGERYDVIVRAESTFWRVQVKSVLARHQSRPSHHVQTVTGRDRRTYSLTEIDFLAAYIFEKDVWYVFPAAVIANRQGVFVRPDSPKCRYLVYREAWDLMKPNSAGRETPPATSEGTNVKPYT